MFTSARNSSMGAVLFNGNLCCFPGVPSTVRIHVPKCRSGVPADLRKRNICESVRDCIVQPRKRVVAAVPCPTLNCRPEVLNASEFAVELKVKNCQVAAFGKQLFQQAALVYKVWLPCHEVAPQQASSALHGLVFKSLVVSRRPGCQRPRSSRMILRPFGSP